MAIIIAFLFFNWLPNIIPASSILVFIDRFTPFYLIMQCGRWFIAGNPFTNFIYYEAITIAIWSVLMIIIAKFSAVRYYKINL